MTLNKKRLDAFSDSLRVVASLFLVTVYIGGTVEFDAFHQLVHQDSSELHTAQHEADPCHRAIYHQQLEGCDHNEHITETDHCSLCSIITQSEIILPELENQSAKFDSITWIVSEYRGERLFAFQHIPSRAPPCLI